MNTATLLGGVTLSLWENGEWEIETPLRDIDGGTVDGKLWGMREKVIKLGQDLATAGYTDASYSLFYIYMFMQYDVQVALTTDPDEQKVQILAGMAYAKIQSA